jgi:hypothetical protein
LGGDAVSLNHLSDAELIAFANDPQTFLSNKQNQLKVLGLDDPALKQRLQALQASTAALQTNAGIVTDIVTSIPTIF